MRTETATTYKFTAGQTFPLDDIYTIQGLGGGNWWEKIPDGGKGGTDMSELCQCVRSVKITVIVEYSS